MFILPLIFACTSAPQPEVPQNAAQPAEQPSAPASLESQLTGGKRVSERVVTGGQPEEALLQQAPGLGFDTVINLRTSGEMPFDEATIVQGLGMTYVHIPVAGAQDLTPENAAKLQAALDASQGQALVHCASGARVRGLMALTDAEE